MDNFDLRKYLAEGRLLKEDVMVNPIIMFFGEVATRPLYHRLVATRHLSE
jgi:hypothetical protein